MMRKAVGVGGDLPLPSLLGPIRVGPTPGLVP
jgi:hypothetical protein